MTCDRLATLRELSAAHRRLKKRNGGPGFELAASRLGISPGTLYAALMQFVPPNSRLRLSQLRAMLADNGAGKPRQ